MRRRTGLARRRGWVLSVGALIAVAVLATASAAASADIPSSKASQPINGVPDVTGAGNPHGSVTLASLQDNAPGTVVSASSVLIDGLDRGYLVIAPTDPPPELPVIVVLGGVTASPTQEAERDELIPIAQAGKAILVYPAGYGESWNVGVDGCCTVAAAAGVDDVGFVAAVTSAVRSDMSISTAYLVGFSNGGKLAYQVLCNEPGLFAAAAMVGATPLASCPSEVALPMMILVGAKDPELPLQGHTEPPVPVYSAALATWRSYNGCTAASSDVGIGTAVITTWTSCSSGNRVVGVLYGGLDHEWPTAALVGANVAGAALIWPFLSNGSTAAAS